MEYIKNFEVTKSPVCAPMWGSEQTLKKGGEGLKGFGLYFVLIYLQDLKGPRCIVGVGACISILIAIPSSNKIMGSFAISRGLTRVIRY